MRYQRSGWVWKELRMQAELGVTERVHRPAEKKETSTKKDGGLVSAPHLQHEQQLSNEVGFLAALSPCLEKQNLPLMRGAFS